MFSLVSVIMRIAFVDIQGFCIDGIFHPKELSIAIGCKQYHALFTPPTPYSNLNTPDRISARYVEKHIHGINYSSGDVDYSKLNSILETYLLNHVDCIYVRGSEKAEFLLKKCHVSRPIIVDVCKFDGTPCATEKFSSDSKTCMYHANGSFKCTQKNVESLRQWFLNCIPL